jgi:hypothetical protein
MALYKIHDKIHIQFGSTTVTELVNHSLNKLYCGEGGF